MRRIARRPWRVAPSRGASFNDRVQFRPASAGGPGGWTEMATKYQPGTRISEYVLDACVGAGSFAEVWRARHHVWEKETVAVKLPIEPEYVRYLQREGIVVHGLRHPNIVRVMGFDPYAEIPYLVMEFVDGPSLRGVIDQRRGTLALGTVLTILRGMLSGIGAAHAAGVLHRDLKPGNVLINLAGRPVEQVVADDVKVTDFGLGIGDADTLRSIAQSASLDREDRLVGTLAYMAPELRDGGGKHDARSDLYAVGVMLFELLTGERPAGAETPSTIRADVPAALDELFRKLYARRDRRFESAAAVSAELERLGAARGHAAPPPVPRRAGATPPPIPRGAFGLPCPKCGAKGEPDDQFCTQCGSQLVESIRRCPTCQGFPGPEDRYCIFCGGALPAPAG